jgi:Fe-S cluster assembly ATP-binding protein
MKGLEIVDLVVETREGKRIIDGLSLEFKDGGRYGLLGPNGSGKSSLVAAIMGHPAYRVVSGQIRLDGRDVAGLGVDERARLGLFLGTQYPAEVAGVSFASFMRTTLGRLRENRLNFLEVMEEMEAEAGALGFRQFDPERELNVGFSGGEKKKSEILQMLLIKPRFAFLDEPDSGLDKRSVELVARRLATIDYPTTLIIITHHDRLLEAMELDAVYQLKGA